MADSYPSCICTVHFAGNRCQQGWWQPPLDGYATGFAIFLHSDVTYGFSCCFVDANIYKCLRKLLVPSIRLKLSYKTLRVQVVANTARRLFTQSQNLVTEIRPVHFGTTKTCEAFGPHLGLSSAPKNFLGRHRDQQLRSSSVSPADVDIPVELNLDSSRFTHMRLVIHQSSLHTAVHERRFLISTVRPRRFLKRKDPLCLSAEDALRPNLKGPEKTLLLQITGLYRPNKKSTPYMKYYYALPKNYCSFYLTGPKSMPISVLVNELQVDNGDCTNGLIEVYEGFFPAKQALISKFCNLTSMPALIGTNTSNEILLVARIYKWTSATTVKGKVLRDFSCNSALCKNAACVQESNTIKCDCTGGYGGPTCQELITKRTSSRQESTFLSKGNAFSILLTLANEDESEYDPPSFEVMYTEVSKAKSIFVNFLYFNVGSCNHSSVSIHYNGNWTRLCGDKTGWSKKFNTNILRIRLEFTKYVDEYQGFTANYTTSETQKEKEGDRLFYGHKERIL
ncbi:hypothetical protein M513_13784, partial [Trichuris suis]